jgi:HPt (histidine-containing phosphotransfer) domain-containing protein
MADSPAKTTAQVEARPAREGAIDRTHLERATAGDIALAREVLALFAAQAETLTEAIAQARDGRTRREAAHRLKGAARGIGAFAVALAAEAIELGGNDRAANAEAVAQLRARVAEARSALDRLLAKG